MNAPSQNAAGSALLGPEESSPHADDPAEMPATPAGSPELFRALAEVKGQAQFLLYLADQIEDSLHQLADRTDATHNAFLCKVLGMYSSQLESRHQGLGGPRL